MTLLNLELQFHFTSGELGATYAAYSQTLTQISSDWRIPLSAWSAYDQLAVQVRASGAPAGLAYSVRINDVENMLSESDYANFAVGLVNWGTSFTVTAHHGDRAYPIKVRCEPQLDALAAGRLDPRPRKVPILVQATTNPPSPKPGGLELMDIIGLLPDAEQALKRFMDRLAHPDAGTIDVAPLTTLLHRTRELVRRLDHRDARHPLPREVGVDALIPKRE